MPVMQQPATDTILWASSTSITQFVMCVARVRVTRTFANKARAITSGITRMVESMASVPIAALTLRTTDGYGPRLARRAVLSAKVVPAALSITVRRFVATTVPRTVETQSASGARLAAPQAALYRKRAYGWQPLARCGFARGPVPLGRALNVEQRLGA